ncbi:MAG: large subunit ribosomal protein L5 [Ulvibacter sp.]|jgi:large subunit ribosomal protein L5
MSYTKELYNKTKKEIQEHFSLKNVMEIPVLEKVSINVAIKATDSNKNILSYIEKELSLIAGQKPIASIAKKSIAGFKLRENSVIGYYVTLRNKKMYDFLDRLIYIALPRVRDFRGLPAKSFNDSYHYSFGITDQSVFLEVDLDNILRTFGMDINIVTNAKSKEQSLYLLKSLNVPINAKIN